jgi:hypothetical protein
MKALNFAWGGLLESLWVHFPAACGASTTYIILVQVPKNMNKTLFQ